MIGQSITGVFWIPDAIHRGGFATYFVLLGSGESYEVRQNGINAATLPANTTPLPAFKPILGGPGVAGVCASPQGDHLVIQLLSDQLLHCFETFDGEEPGNNFTLENPPHEEDWFKAVKMEWRRLFP